MPDTQVTVGLSCLDADKKKLILFHYLQQISDLTPATSYVFLVRAENTQGVSVPSGPSNAIKTLGEDFDGEPSNELSSARHILTAKVSRLILL